jgi:hypothetical protein
MARLASVGAARLVKLDDVERVLRSSDVVIDACRRSVREGEVQVSLVARPVLLALAANLAGCAPEEASRQALADAAFGGLECDGSDLLYCGGGPTGKVRSVRRRRA